jgi:hypothetical protein
MTTTTLHRPPAYERDEPQDTGVLVLLATLGMALLVIGTLALLLVLTLPVLSLGG